ncbi:MAG: helix-turn-helix transcriptional regulator [Oscillospiraceae bacterium]|nr:helix-turn-helix transcriptional regulator [Oscillospiraceae bacterium]
MPRTKYCEFVNELNSSAAKEKKLKQIRNRDKPRDPLMEMVRGRISGARIPAEDVAAYCGVAPTTLYGWLERGSDSIPPAKMMQICEAVGLAEEEFRRYVRQPVV